MQEALRSATRGAHPRATEVTVRDAVCDLMRRFGMTTVFGNPGSTELPLFRHFPDDFRYVLGLQEAVVVGMADGYAQATRNAAFVNLHSAAGVGNAMGNIFTAFKNRTPMVITAGQQARSMLALDPFLASREAAELPKPYVKWSVEPARAEDVPHAIARAYYLAMMPPRGPVLVSVPVDDWDRAAEFLPVRVVSRQVRPDPVVLDQIARALDAAARPVFVVGGAVDRDEAFDDVVRLAEAHNARVFVAPMTGRCSFPEDHSLFAGFLPAMRERIVSLLADSDLVFAIGAPAFTYHVEGFGAHVPPGAKLVQLIDDPHTASWTPEGIAAVGSIRLGLVDLLAQTRPPARSCPPARVAAPRVQPTAPLSTAYVLQSLAEMRPAESIIVEEAPSARPVMQAHLPILTSEGFLHDGQRRPWLRHAGGRRRRAGKAGQAGDRHHRRRLEPLFDSVDLECGATGAADHLRHPEQSPLRRTAGLRPGIRIRGAGAGSGHRPAGSRLRRDRNGNGLSRDARPHGRRAA